MESFIDYFIQQIKQIPNNLIANLLIWPIGWLFWKGVQLFLLWLRGRWKYTPSKFRDWLKRQKWFKKLSKLLESLLESLKNKSNNH